jgi:GNAT superfamily N-acetyltransferase
MYLNDQMIGRADYRIFNNQSPYWYIDEFIISEQFRGKGYGSCLLNYIIEKMLSEQKLPIDIYPTGQLISKKTFIAWLLKRGFVQLPPMKTGQIFLRLQP